jgi:penicillin-insensitive murein DD-endopeptidase
MHFVKNSLALLVVGLFAAIPAAAKTTEKPSAKAAVTQLDSKKTVKKKKRGQVAAKPIRAKTKKRKLEQTASLATSAPTVQPTSAKPTTVSLDRIPAKKLFGNQKAPANITSRAIGSYARGCLAGAKSLPITGEAWQVMRVSRNRNWAHPDMITLLERLARESQTVDKWPGLLVGDLAQPRGGPMLTGHASHQIGLDADVWLTPMPDRVLTSSERENMTAVVMTKSRTEIDKSRWTEGQAKLIKRAASYPEVARIFVHPPIKAELCKWATGDKSWLAKVRPYYGHNYHFHIRMTCPKGFPGCKNQWAPKPSDATGCGEELAYWIGSKPWKAKAPDPKAPIKVKPVPPLTLSGLPAECRGVIAAP